MLVNKPPYIIYLKSLGNITKTAKRDAIAVWPFIFISEDKERTDNELKTLIQHEKIHHQQQIRGWHIGFYLKYFYYHFTLGYKNNPYEIEAYQHQDDWKK